MVDPDHSDGFARYVFRVTFGVEPTIAGVTVEPAEFDTRLYREADPPGEEGWLFFRDNLWRGDLADADYFRELTEEALDVPVRSVSFSELQTDETYLDSLRSELTSHLDEFNADSVDKVLSTFLGSSIRVVSASEDD